MKENQRSEMAVRRDKKLKKVMVLIVSMALFLIMSVPAFCATTGTSILLDYPEVATTLTDVQAKIVPTVLQIVGIVVGSMLVLWAISFAIKKGISVMQKYAKRAL